MLRPGIQVTSGRRPPTVSKPPVRLPAGPEPMRPGELRRAKAKLLHAAQGHREIAAHHRGEAAKAQATVPVTPKAKRDRGDGVTEDAPAAVVAEPPIEGGQHSHTTMAEVHEIAAAELQAKAEALR